MEAIGLRAVLLFSVVAVLLVEVVGYLWHRFAEHYGWMGNAIRYRHWVHHELDYPIDNLRPEHLDNYRNAGSWSWYIVGGFCSALIYWLLPLVDAIALSLGATLYAICLISYLHSRFHIKAHWLERFGWFRRVRRLHDIHHWKPCNYGILFFWMDALFGTLCKDFPTKQEDIFPSYRH